MKLLAISLMIVTAPAVADSASDPPHTINQADKAAIREAVNSRLSDPESAHFKWLPATGAGQIYCGFVNAKNRFGGYAGFVPFAAIIFEHGEGKPPWAGALAVGSALPDAPETLAIVQTCTKAGIDMGEPTTTD